MLVPPSHLAAPPGRQVPPTPRSRLPRQLPPRSAAVSKSYARCGRTNVAPAAASAREDGPTVPSVLLVSGFAAPAAAAAGEGHPLLMLMSLLGCCPAAGRFLRRSCPAVTCSDTRRSSCLVRPAQVLQPWQLLRTHPTCIPGRKTAQHRHGHAANHQQETPAATLSDAATPTRTCPVCRCCC